MTTQIRMPKLGFSMQEARLLKWAVQDGNAVEEGQILYTLEMDKAIQEMESPASGVIRILAGEDEAYEVGALLATIE